MGQLQQQMKEWAVSLFTDIKKHIQSDIKQTIKIKCESHEIFPFVLNEAWTPLREFFIHELAIPLPI